MAKALQVRSRNPAGCDKIAHESKPLRSAAAADAVHLAIDRPVFLFDRGIAVCFANGRCLCLADERAEPVVTQLVPIAASASSSRITAARTSFSMLGQGTRSSTKSALIREGGAETVRLIEATTVEMR